MRIGGSTSLCLLDFLSERCILSFYVCFFSSGFALPGCSEQAWRSEPRANPALSIISFHLPSCGMRRGEVGVCVIHDLSGDLSWILGREVNKDGCLDCNSNIVANSPRDHVVAVCGHRCLDYGSTIGDSDRYPAKD